LNTLAALAAGDAEDFSERCLARIRQTFPALARLSVLTPLRVGGGWRERVRSPAEAEPLAPEWRSALAAEAAEQPNG
ncbi:MAG: hypothetical protein RMM29_10090, partial [Planctomycetota bacterium]|nr:hypothetical protein [Planctomycetota bacterium]